MKTLIHASVLILATLALLCSCGNDYTLDIYGTIEGKVTDVTTGDPLNAAQVTLVPTAKTIQTGIDGSFVFSDLDEGQYTVSVQKDGYQSNRKNITVISGETTNVVVTLTEIPKN